MTKAKQKTEKKQPKKAKAETVADILKRRAEKAKLIEERAEKKRLAEEQKRLKREERERLANLKNIDNSQNTQAGTRVVFHETEYLLFIEFMATPRIYRELESQAEFSKKFKISETTLSTWKNRPDFRGRVRAQRSRYISEEILGDALVALKKTILKEGKAPEVKLMFQLADEFEEKSSVEVKKPSTLTDEQRARFADRLQRWKKENLTTNDDEE